MAEAPAVVLGQLAVPTQLATFVAVLVVVVATTDFVVGVPGWRRRPFLLVVELAVEF